MIETGTTDEFKQSVLGNIAWAPSDADLIRTKKAFEAQDLEVAHCFVNVRMRLVVPVHEACHTIKVRFVTKRNMEGALFMAKRAVRSLRLALCAFNEETPGLFPGVVRTYTVEIRGHD